MSSINDQLLEWFRRNKKKGENPSFGSGSDQKDLITWIAGPKLSTKTPYSNISETPTFDFVSEYTKQMIRNQMNGSNPPYKPPPVTDAQRFSYIDQMSMEEQEPAVEEVPSPEADDLSPFVPTQKKSASEPLAELNDFIERLKLFDGKPDANDKIMYFTPIISSMESIRDRIRWDQEKFVEFYMAQPAAWTESELKARALQQSDDWAYNEFVTSDAYLDDNWNRWLELGEPGRTLTTAEREEAKMAADALGRRAEMLYWSHMDPTYLTREEVQRYNTLIGLAGILESKESGAEAAILGAANVIPVEKFSSMLHEAIPAFGEYQDSLYSDKSVADLMAGTSLTGNAQVANPGWYTAGNIAGNAATMALGAGALKGLGIGSQATSGAILTGTIGGAHSAANQDWSKPGQAALNMAGDVIFNAAVGYTGGKVAEMLDDVIKRIWYESDTVKPAGSLKWPESEQELVATAGVSGYTEGAGKLNPKDIKPPEWNSKWEWRYPEANKPNAKPRWFDPNGGEWRWHAPDKWHPEGHWDYNPWDTWNSKWQNIYPD